jgi:hypothetical protein
MTETRYRLAEQLHFRADIPRRENVIVTVQRWESITGKTRKAMYVTCIDGIEQTRRLCVTDDDLAHLTTVMTRTAAEHGPDLLSEEAAATAVTRRGGPKMKWCHRQDCGEPVPYAAAQCGSGHPVDSVGRVQMLGTRRNGPPIVMHTGGPNRG